MISDRLRRTVAWNGPWRKGTLRTISVIALALGSMQVAGCVTTGGGSSGPVFSPDGTQIAFLWEDNVQELAVDGKTWYRKIALHWCKTRDPTMESSVSIESLGAEFAGYSRVPIPVKWSSHGSHIGVLTPHKLMIVEANSQKKVELRDGIITSFSWLSDNEVAYCARRREKKMQRRVICWQRADDDKPREVVAFDWHPQSKYTWQEHWSPSGQYVIFVEPASGGRFHVVNVLDETWRAFGQTNVHDIGVAWAQDFSQVFCVSDKVGPEDVFEAFMLDPLTGKTVDCTENFRMFAGSWPSLESLWTADDRYVIVNALRNGGHLVQPVPWTVIPLGKIFKSASATKYRMDNPCLFQLPAPGWVGVIPTGNQGSSPVNYVTDYYCKHAHPMLEAGGSWTISPDGTVAATVGQDRHVRIHLLGKWWLPFAAPGQANNPGSGIKTGVSYIESQPKSISR